MKYKYYRLMARYRHGDDDMEAMEYTTGHLEH